MRQAQKIGSLLSQLRPPKQSVDTPPEILRAREDFFEFCRIRNPKFYQPERQYQIDLCRELQDFMVSDDMVLVVNLPPRHGKSYTAQLFSQWVFGRRPDTKIMTGSYNETLSKTFARSVRNGISERKADRDVIVYSDIFPGVRIARGDSAARLWSIEGQYNSYLATSPSGTATGFGASLLIIDDLIKNSYEAYNAGILDKHWSWFTDTMLSRLESGGKVIIIMTRWASGDLAGRAIDHFAGLGIPCRVVKMPAEQPDGSMLCEDVLSRRDYEIKTATMSLEIASANYNQIPIDLKGCLYGEFATYDKRPEAGIGDIYSYTDTADTGSDYTCSINWIVHDHKAYIINVLYTKDAMEYTEPATARMLDEDNVGLARIESNNGGRGFARSVRRHLEQDLRNYRCRVSSFTQHKNKTARILSNATRVQQHVVMPTDWRYKWPEFFEAVTKYQKEGKNAHDDAPDALTGIAETMIRLGL